MEPGTERSADLQGALEAWVQGCWGNTPREFERDQSRDRHRSVRADRRGAFPPSRRSGPGPAAILKNPRVPTAVDERIVETERKRWVLGSLAAGFSEVSRHDLFNCELVPSRDVLPPQILDC